MKSVSGKGSAQSAEPFSFGGLVYGFMIGEHWWGLVGIGRD